MLNQRLLGEGQGWADTRPCTPATFSSNEQHQPCTLRKGRQDTSSIGCGWNKAEQSLLCCGRTCICGSPQNLPACLEPLPVQSRGHGQSFPNPDQRGPFLLSTLGKLPQPILSRPPCGVSNLAGQCSSARASGQQPASTLLNKL